MSNLEKYVKRLNSVKWHGKPLDHTKPSGLSVQPWIYEVESMCDPITLNKLNYKKCTQKI